MTDGPGTTAGPLATPRADEIAGGRLARNIALSRAALALERAWPRLWLPTGVLGVFLVASLAGLWPLLPATWHLALLAAFGLAVIAALVPLVRLSWPTRAEGLARLETLSGLAHRPASSYEDQVAPAASTEAGQALWTAHRQRLSRLIERMRAQPPRPRTEARDPFALRALMLLVASVLLLLAGDAVSDRVASAFRFGPALAVVATRLDAWVTPPAYTGRQPILILDGGAAETLDQQSSRRFEIPEGSQLLVRAAGPAHASYSVQTVADGGAAPVSVAGQPKADPAIALTEFRVALAHALTVRVTDSGMVRQSWQFQVIPDQPPTIALTGEPKQGARGSLILDYRVTDDYGVASAEAEFALADAAQSKPLKLADGTEIGPLGEAPRLPLKLPKSASSKDLRGRSSLDLAAHPWAGLKVKMTLRARDHGGRTGEAEPAPFVLPERVFRNPLARALIEQRRKLDVSPGDYRDVRLALDALAIAPDQFPIAAGAYLGLRSAYLQLTGTPSRELFGAVSDQLWQLALKLENGRLSQAEQALKDAEDRLAKALEEGASDAELQKLMQDLRQAMNDFLRSLAEQGQSPPDQQANGQDNKELTSKDFEQMMQRLQEMAKSGNRDAAQQMLSQMRDLLDRLQSGRAADKGQNGRMRELMDKFGNLIGKQKRLLDDTFKTGRDRRNGDNRAPGDDGKGGKGKGEEQGGLDELDKRQGDLRGELDQLLKDLQGLGGKPRDPLTDAGQSMEDARQSLQNADPDSAADKQARALEQLRKGAQSLAEDMLKGQGGKTGGRAGNGERDPLDRPLPDQSLEFGPDNPMLPKEYDVQRSRHLIEELRRRLGETTRPPGELDYLERLLK